MMIMMLILPMLVAVATADYPLPAQTPPHSWTSVANRVFLHGCKRDGLFNATELEFAKRFPILTVEKGQGESLPGFAEDKMAALSKQYKAARPDGWSLFYMNMVFDWEMYRMHQHVVADPTLVIRNANGSACCKHGDPSFPQPAAGMFVWNLSNPNTRDLLISTCEDAATDSGGSFDGCFLDGAGSWEGCTDTRNCNPPHCDLAPGSGVQLAAGNVKILQGMQTAVGNKGLVVAKDGGGNYNDTRYVNTVFMSDTFCSCYRCASWDATYVQKCIEQIEGATTVGQRGQVVFMHGEANQSPTPFTSDDNVFTFSLAAFLVSAYDKSFFGYSDGWYYNGSKWWEEYDRPLGTPLHDAVVMSHGVYQRNFTHASVHLDVHAYKAVINWI